MSSTLNFLWCAVCLRERRPRLGEAPSTSGREAAVTVLDGRALCAEHVAEVLDAANSENDRIETAEAALVDHLDGVVSNPWDDPGFRAAINELSAALNRQPGGLDG